MVTKRNSLSDTRRESFYTELHALLTAGLDFSQAFRLLIDGERDARIKALLKTKRAGWRRHSNFSATISANGPYSGE